MHAAKRLWLAETYRAEKGLFMIQQIESSVRMRGKR